jgi:DNA polymerase-3 subunit epsilon
MARWINQDRPVVFFDLETTGTNRTTDRIVEIALVRIDAKGAERTFHSLVNPGIPIPEEASKVHGITDEAVKTAPAFKNLATEILAFMQNADLAGFNIARFDIEVLAAEFDRASAEFTTAERRIFDALNIYHDREPRDLQAAHRFYCGTPLEDAHSALADTKATIRVLRGQFERYPDLPTNPDELHAECNKPRRPDAIDREAKLIMRNGEPTINFGQKYPGVSLIDIAAKDPGFLDWMVFRGDFSPEVKAVVADVLCAMVHPDDLHRPSRRRKAVSAADDSTHAPATAG